MNRDPRDIQLRMRLDRARSLYAATRGLKHDLATLLAASELLGHSGREVQFLRDAERDVDAMLSASENLGRSLKRAIECRVEEREEQLRESEERREADRGDKEALEP